MSITTTLATLAAGLTLVGGLAAVVPASVPAPQFPGAVTRPAVKPADATTSATLLFSYEEERMARDLYRLFADTYPGARPFASIANAEQQHLSAVGALLATYGLSAPDRPAGTYGDPELQRLYDAWKGQGLTSLKDAQQVGVALETRDIADLESLLAGTAQPDVKTVLEHLLAGSRNHLRAFEAAVAGTTPAGPMDPQGTGRLGNGPGTGTPRGDTNGDGVCDVTGQPVGSGSGQQSGRPGAGLGPRANR